MSAPFQFERLTVLSAFTGAGGLDLGLEAAGFETLACIERDTDARATIAANRPNWPIIDTLDVVDVAAEITPSSLGLARRELSILAGGPPCQPFSKAAQWVDNGRAGLLDPRSKSLSAFLVIAERFLPKVILIENVEGFCTGKTSAVPMLRAALSGINRRCTTDYKLHNFVVDAADYGVAQHRRRAIVIACRGGEIVLPPQPTTTTDDTRIRAFDALAGIEPTDGPPMRGRWAELLPSIPEGCNYQHHTEHGRGLPIFGFRTRFWSFLLKLAQNRPAWTISAQPGPATGPFHWNNRPLTTVELLRLQSFPADWHVEGKRTAQVRQIGNATPPLLAEFIGRQIASHVFGRVYAGAPSLRILRQPVAPTLTQPAAVPDRFRANARRVPKAHPGVGRGPGAVERKKRVARDKRRASLAAKTRSRPRNTVKKRRKPRATDSVVKRRRKTRASRGTTAVIHPELVEKSPSRSRARSDRGRTAHRSPKRGSPSTRAA